MTVASGKRTILAAIIRTMTRASFVPIPTMTTFGKTTSGKTTFGKNDHAKQPHLARPHLTRSNYQYAGVSAIRGSRVRSHDGSQSFELQFSKGLF
jgi:hypothetical protein